MNILSLFDGISCGQIALQRANIPYKKYFASEINKHAIKVTQHHYPQTIQLGNVINIKGKQLPKITLLMGGFPCQDLSRNNPRGNGLNARRSGLFWELVRLIHETRPQYFLVENVRMQREWRDVISQELKVEPVEINSALVSAQNRIRLYWTNLPVTQPKDKQIVFRDIIYDDKYKVFSDKRITRTKYRRRHYVQWDLSGKGYDSQQDRAYFKDGKLGTLPKSNPGNRLNIVMDYEKDVYRRLHPVEAERLQTIPDNYTNVEGISPVKRLQLLGDAWTVDVIAHILREMT